MIINALKYLEAFMSTTRDYGFSVIGLVCATYYVAKKVLWLLRHRWSVSKELFLFNALIASGLLALVIVVAKDPRGSGSAYATVAVVIVALYQEQFRRMFFRPRLRLAINTEKPDCHLVSSGATNEGVKSPHSALWS